MIQSKHLKDMDNLRRELEQKSASDILEIKQLKNANLKLTKELSFAKQDLQKMTASLQNLPKELSEKSKQLERLKKQLQQLNNQYMMNDSKNSQAQKEIDQLIR